MVDLKKKSMAQKGVVDRVQLTSMIEAPNAQNRKKREKRKAKKEADRIEKE